MSAIFPSVGFRGAPIGGLFLARRPATVLGTVWAVIVDALKRVSGRGFRPHVSQKCREVIQPPWVYLNSTAPIVLPCRTIGNIASRLEAGPSCIQRMPCTTRRQAVRSGTLSRSVAIETPAAFGVPRNQIFAGHRMGLTASAAAFPTSASCCILRGDLENGQSGIGLAPKINRFHAMEYNDV